MMRPEEHFAAQVRNVVIPFTSAKLGGSHISGVTLGVGLKQRFDARCIVVAPQTAKVLALAEEMGLETRAVAEPPASRRWPHTDLLGTPSRIRHLRELGSDTVIHCNDLAALQAWLLAAKLTRTPIVYHNRGFARDFAPYRFVMRRADHVIPISAACDRRLGFIAAERRTILTNPFLTPADYDASETRTGILRELGAPADSKLVGFIGNFWRRKRPLFFADIAARLAADDAGMRFVFYGREGDVGLAEMNERIARPGLAGRTLIAGFRLPPEANIASLDLLLMPALDEPFGRTLVEALLMGVPYVATDDAGHAEIHGRWGGGILLPKDAGVEAYAHASRAALADPDAVTLPVARRREIAESLRPEHHAGQVMTIYEQLMRG